MQPRGSVLTAEHNSVDMLKSLWSKLTESLIVLYELCDATTEGFRGVESGGGASVLAIWGKKKRQVVFVRSLSAEIEIKETYLFR